MNNHTENRWKFGKRDAIVIGIALSLILVLTLGSSERKTKDTPNDAMHAEAHSRHDCLQCHGPKGVRPQPLGHPSTDQCFLCHKQPTGWKAKP